MANVLIESQTMTDIADAIREKNGTENTYKPADMPQAVRDIETQKVDLSEYATKDYVEQEIANFDFIKIVTKLPETGLVNRTYFVPKIDTETNDLYDEYMWVDGKWEVIGTKKIEVDLTNYVSKSSFVYNEETETLSIKI